jgi:hypothetical protein
VAYLRYSETCKVYLYRHVDGFYECCGCLLAPNIYPFPQFDQEAAADHVLLHKAARHLPDEMAITAIEQLLGYAEKPLDLVVVDLVSQARAAGGMVSSDDVEVPQDIRLSMRETLEKLAQQASGEGPGVEFHVPEEFAREASVHLTEWQGTN